MRNRDYKEFAPNTYYHVYNRGVAKQDIFLDNTDYSFFLHRLKEGILPNDEEVLFNNKKDTRRKLLPPDSFELVCYCLMPNHFHLLIKQLKEVPISTLILKLCTSHSMYFNKKYSRVGSLFQGTFKAIAVENNDYLFWLSLYIHQNPIEAGIVNDLSAWPWSSYLDYVGRRDGILCEKSIILEQLKTSSNYEKMMDREVKKTGQPKRSFNFKLD